MTDQSTPAAVPAGWYPDPNAPGGQRWWDGTRWTEHVGQPAETVPAVPQAPTAQQAPAATQQPTVQQTSFEAAAPYQPFQAQQAPAGTRTGTVWIWLIVLLPLLSLLPLLFIDWPGFIQDSLQPGMAGALAGYDDPAYLASQASGWVLYILTIVFAALDRRELLRRGVPAPFHWAFAFLPSIVYVIGRSVVVKRRTGGGLAPLWAYIAVSVVSLIAGITLAGLLMNYIFASVS